MFGKERTENEGIQNSRRRAVVKNIKWKEIQGVIAILFMVSFLGITGCNKTTEVVDTPVSTEEDSQSAVVVTEIIWGESGSGPEEKRSFEVIKVGDIISDTIFGTIKVVEVTKEELVLGFEGGFAKYKDTGSISLLDDPLTEFRLGRGDTVKLGSQTMDAGVIVTVTFN